MSDESQHIHYLQCPWCYAVNNIKKEEEEEFYKCPVCKRKFIIEDLEIAREKEEE